MGVSAEFYRAVEKRLRAAIKVSGHGSLRQVSIALGLDPSALSKRFSSAGVERWTLSDVSDTLEVCGVPERDFWRSVIADLKAAEVDEPSEPSEPSGLVYSEKRRLAPLDVVLHDRGRRIEDLTTRLDALEDRVEELEAMCESLPSGGDGSTRRVS